MEKGEVKQIPVASSFPAQKWNEGHEGVGKGDLPKGYTVIRGQHFIGPVTWFVVLCAFCAIGPLGFLFLLCPFDEPEPMVVIQNNDPNVGENGNI